MQIEKETGTRERADADGNMYPSAVLLLGKRHVLKIVFHKCRFSRNNTAY